MHSRYVILGCLLYYLSVSSSSVLAQAPAAPNPTPPAVESAPKAKQSADDSAKSADKSAKSAVDSAKSAEKSGKSADDSAESAEKSGKSAADAAKSADESGNSADQAKAEGILRRLAQRKGSPKKPPLNDYVPCLFGGTEDFEIRARPNPYDQPISANDAENIASIVISRLQANKAVAEDKLPLLKNNIIDATIGTTPLLAIQNLHEVLIPAAKEHADLTKVKAAINTANAKQEDPRKAIRDTLQESHSHFYTMQLQTKIDSLDDKTAKNAEKMTTIIAREATDQLASASVGAVIPQKQTFNRPDDVVCSFSIMGWQETSDVFGRRVANDYIAIQVNVRNLSTDSEFLIHDIQMAVDTGVNPRQFSRFQAGRDRIIVRSVSQRGQSEDRRNLILNTMQMLGNIAGGASTAFTHVTSDDKDTTAADKLSTAVALFQGPFITGLINIFPDHTLEHINHISDLAFSASSTNKTVVPIQGAVPLVTFLAEKPLEQLPFSRCGFTTKSTDTTPGPGNVKYRFCKLEPDDDITATIDPEPDAYTKPLGYKHWKPAALQVLERRVYVVVAGVHIQEVSNAPIINAVKCPLAGPENVVDLSQADKDGVVACNLDGKHLDKADSARLVFKTRSIPATIEAASDGNNGTMSFKADDFKGADTAGDYKIFLKDTSGNDNDTKQSLKFGVRVPTVDGATPLTIPQGQQSGQITIMGKNLDRIEKVKLTNGADKSATGDIQNKDSITSRSEKIDVTFSITDLGNLGTLPLTAHIELTTKDGNIAPKDKPDIQVPKPPTK